MDDNVLSYVNYIVVKKIKNDDLKHHHHNSYEALF